MRREQAETARPLRRKRRDATEIRDLILEAAAEEFEESGFSRATTAAIARRADVTEAQIFRCFPSKAVLFRAAIFEPLNRHFSDFQIRQLADSRQQEPLRDRTRAYISELQSFMGTHSRMLMSLVVAEAYEPSASGGNDGASGARGRAGGAEPEDFAGLATYFDRGAAMMGQRIGAPAGEVRVQPELMVRVSFAALLGCALFSDWMFPDGLASPEAIRDAVIAFVIDGINANPGHGDAAAPGPGSPNQPEQTKARP